VCAAGFECSDRGVCGRGLHSSTFQLNLSRFGHKLHPKHLENAPNSRYTPLKQPLNLPPIPQKALKLS